MSPDRKDRLVSFRLSDQEYRALRGFCSTNGIRNLSDFARTAVRGLVEARNARPEQTGFGRPVDSAAGFAVDVRSLNDTMLRLTEAVGQLSLLIERRVVTDDRGNGEG